MKHFSKNHWLGLFILACLASMVYFNVASRHPVFAQMQEGTAEPPRVDEETERREAYMEQYEKGLQPDPASQALMAATPCVGGMAGSYPCMNVDLLAFIPNASLGGGGANDIWGWTDPLDGKEYAIMGRTNGTSFVDITDPENPVYLGNLPTHTGTSTWRDIKVYADYAFVVSDLNGSHGMQVFDLTHLRNVISPPVTFAEDAHYAGFGSAHNIVINEDTGFAYVVGASTCSGGLTMINIQNPLVPTSAGCYSADGYTHDAQCVIYNGPDTNYQGNEICFNSNEDTLTIADVTNKVSPVTVSVNPYAGDSYTHQGWITEDHAFFLLGDELDENDFGHNTRTRIWELSDLTNPTIIGVHDGPNPSIDHNMYVHDGYVFQSNYSSGLQIYDLADIVNGNLTLVAYFDSYIPNNAVNFDGSWSNYPYFESGTMVHTGRSEGLFITRPLLAPTFKLTAQDDELTVCTPGSVGTLFTLIDEHNYTDTVTMSADNLPVGSVPTFDPLMVEVPGTSTMTVTVSTTTAGTYPFTVSATDGVLTETVDLTLFVYDTLPGIVTLLNPADEATDVDVPVTFSWNAGTQSVSYNFELATDATFTNIVYTANVAGTSHIAKYGFDELTTYFWRVQSVNLCGESEYSPIFSFSTEDIPPILLVDDDDNSPNVRNYYTQALDYFGLVYDIWNTGNTDNEPTLADLAPYDIVIWFSGGEYGGAAGPGPGGELALASWLDTYQGCFFLSSQDYYYDRGLTSFMQTYLGADSLDNDSGNYGTVNGYGVYGELGSKTLFYPFTDRADIIVPNGTSNLGIVGDNGNGAAITKDNGYKTSFWAFPWEAIYGVPNRRTAMDLFLDWCVGEEPTPTPSPTPSPTVTPTPTATLPPGDEEFPVFLPVIQR